jgi:autotransporter-associated beta strand protein
MKTEYSKGHLRAVTAALALGALCLVALPAPGATRYWDGGSAINSDWDNAFNWDPNAVPDPGDDLVFGRADAKRPENTNDFPAGTVFGSITITEGGYALRGNRVVLTNGVSVNAGSSDIYCDVTLGAAQILTCAAAANIGLHGSLNLSSYTLTVDGGSVGLHGLISGTGGLLQTGGEVFITGYSGHNTYSGRTRIWDGTLHLGKGNIGAPRLAVPGPLEIGGGSGAADSAVARVFLDDQIGQADVTVRSDGRLYLQSASDEIRSLTLSAGHVETSPDALTVAVGITSRVASATALIEGKLELGAGGCVVQVEDGAASPDLRVTAVLSGGGLTKTGAGTLALDANNSGYGGTVTVNAGQVQVNHNSALGTTAAGTVVNNGGVLTLPGGRSIGVEPLTLNGNGDGRSGALASSAGVNSWAGPITVVSNADITVGEGSTLSLSGVIGGPGGFTKAQRDEALPQTGTLVLTGLADNTFAGDAQVDAGVLEMDKTGAFKSVPTTLHVGTSSGAAHSAVARNTEDLEVWGGNVVVNKSGLYDLNGHNDTIHHLTLNQGGDVQTGAGTLSLMSSSTVTVNASPTVPTVATLAGKLNVGSGSRGFDVGFGYRLPGDPSHLVIEAVVSGSATIVKTGTGEMELAAANNFTGGVTVSDGNLLVTHASALGTTGGGTTVGNEAQLLLSGSLAVGNEALTLNSSSAGALSASEGNSSWAGAITLAADARVAVATGRELDLRGAIGGAGGLIKEGDGRLLFSGAAANTFGGVTRVNAGTLELAKTVYNGAVPGDLFIGDGSGGAEADVVFVTDSSQIDDTAVVTITNSGRLELSGVVGLVEDIGLLVGSGVVQLGSMELQVGTDNLACTYNGIIKGLGSFTKEGASQVILAGANTYSGQTTVRKGKLVVNGSQPTSPVQVEGAGTLAGNGRVGQITGEGKVAPGASPGLLTSGPATLDCGSFALDTDSASLEVELNGPAPDTGYDQVNVAGAVKLGSTAGSAALKVSVGYPPAEGDQFMIIANDGTDEVLGRFKDLPDGAVTTATAQNPLKFRISYFGGSGNNDVVLTVTDTALVQENVAVLMGNGNGILDTNECDALEVILRNRDAVMVAGIETRLTCATPGVWVTQGESAYPDLPPEAMATNSRPFQVSLSHAVPCGTRIQFALAVSTDAHGSFTIPFEMISGSQGASRAYAGRAPGGGAIPPDGLVIPDRSGADDDWIESKAVVTDPAAIIAKLEVSCHLTHPNAGELDLWLVAPDGTEIALSTDNGGSGANYGQGCAEAGPARTYFDDGAATSIIGAAAPFIGRFRPEAPLSIVRGLPGAGEWTLRVKDDTDNDISGLLLCWTLHLSPFTCPDGGGQCLPCPNVNVLNKFAVGDPLTSQRLVQNGVAGVCGTTKPCPGFWIPPDPPLRWHSYTFQNGATGACVTVELVTSGVVIYSAAYRGAFTPGDPCQRLAADAGRYGSASYGFLVGPREVFTVAVTGPPPTDYLLRVSGGSCQPWLNIVRAPQEKVLLTWPTFAYDYHLDATNVAEQLTNCVPLSASPIVSNSQCLVTNATPPPAQFYRLHRP